jgi:transposase-like protein
MLSVRWYLRYGLSYRDLEELLAERGIEAGHFSLYRWVQMFTPLLGESARPCRHAVGERWFVDETYVKVAGVWRYLYRAVDADGQILAVYVPKRRDATAATRFFAKVRRDQGEPDEITADRCNGGPEPRRATRQDNATEPANFSEAVWLARVDRRTHPRQPPLPRRRFGPTRWNQAATTPQGRRSDRTLSTRAHAAARCVASRSNRSVVMDAGDDKQVAVADWVMVAEPNRMIVRPLVAACIY